MHGFVINAVPVLCPRSSLAGACRRSDRLATPTAVWAAPRRSSAYGCLRRIVGCPRCVLGGPAHTGPPGGCRAAHAARSRTVP